MLLDKERAPFCVGLLMQPIQTPQRLAQPRDKDQPLKMQPPNNNATPDPSKYRENLDDKRNRQLVE